MQLLHNEITDKIIYCFYHVYNKLQYGYLEKVYQNALVIELKKQGFLVETEKKLSVYYDNVLVGVYYADIVVNDLVILELKTVDTLLEEHFNQLKSYLRSTHMEVGLLLNFGPKAQFKRCLFTNDKKNFPS